MFAPSSFVPRFEAGERNHRVDLRFSGNRRKFGEHWALNRVLMRVESTLPIPKLGKGFDLSLQFDDYVMNSGVEDAFFQVDPAR